MSARRRRGARKGRLGGAAVVILLIAAGARGQIVNELEPERPLTMEDAHPLPYRAVSSSVDWTSNWRAGQSDYGPGFSFSYGLVRALEVGASLRYVSSPEVNASRGISSGDLLLHALYGITPETASWPALAMRVGVEFPTGLDSKGTDLHLEGLATRTLGVLRLHANFGWTRLGATGPTERKDRLEGVAGIDWLTSSRGLTDTLLLTDVVVRTNPVRDEQTIVTIEAGGRFRIGSRTVFFAGIGADVTGSHDRAKFRLRAGITYVF